MENKLIEMLPSKYYYITQNCPSKTKWIVQCSAIEGDYLVAQDCVSLDKDGYSDSRYPGGGSWGILDIIEHVRLASNEEIAWFKSVLKGKINDPIPLFPSINNSYSVF